MQIRIAHTTTFEYDGKAVASYNQARLTPLTTPEQIALHTRLEVSPSPWTYQYRDYFGTLVTSFEVVDPHDAMTVTATSTVQTQRPVPPPPSLSWAALGEREVADRWTEYLTLPDIVEPPADFAQRAKQIAADHELPGEAARDLCAMVHDEVEYLPGATDVQTHAATAWQQRAGVCQDMVHLVIGGLRSVGIPARYVSGYFHPIDEPVVGDHVTGESHAWVEWWDDGWHAFDPTNDTTPGNRYVVVATGRDYRDVKPLSGIYSGAQTSRMTVEVDLTRLA
ncbi:transglutaminase family protein [Nocardioides sp. cx-173]|uniref:transglutaminase family protein n=1 Tax=Nocardioides sp. cx-173 TaxID=2898796 RepID=UPI001E48F545|nr:transglutaminase family protein [Nocardioides sp. cx-173]MCD4527478.1 transglutaminase family protein [Nocardioides sp. cx-173]UGB40333.1 transglutaminase family protein [Nocardioides sp. cx-173]